MSSRVKQLDAILRKLLLVSLLFFVIAGPAAVIGLENFFDDDMFGESTLWDWAPLVLTVWLCAVPFGVAHSNWKKSPSTSVASLTIFVGVLLLMTLVGIPVVRMASALVVAPALSVPFNWFDISGIGVEGTFRVSIAGSIVVLFAIPIAAVVFQIFQMNRKSES